MMIYLQANCIGYKQTLVPVIYDVYFVKYIE